MKPQPQIACTPEGLEWSSPEGATFSDSVQGVEMQDFRLNFKVPTVGF